MALIAMAFYAMEIAITDFKLSEISPRLLTLIYSLGVAFIAFISLFLQPEQSGAPSANQFSFIVLMIVASFIAATAHFVSIHQGIGTAKLTTIYALMPVIGSVYVAIVKKEMPNTNLILAWCLAAGALYLVSTTKIISIWNVR